MEVRPMQATDIAGLMAVGEASLWGGLDSTNRERLHRRVGHLLAVDPGGAWVAAADGTVVGGALALRREGLWYLSFLAVGEAAQGRGCGRRLLEAALGHRGGAERAVILSSEHPAAMRLYATAGLRLHPAVSLFGMVTEPPPLPSGVRPCTVDDHGWMEALAREIRGAAYGPDLARLIDYEPVCLGQDGWAVAVGGRLTCLLARDEQTARALLAHHLARVPAGEKASVDFLTAGQDWAIEVGLRTGLALSPDGPVFADGPPLTALPWVPSGSYL